MKEKKSTWQSLCGLRMNWAMLRTTNAAAPSHTDKRKREIWLNKGVVCTYYKQQCSIRLWLRKYVCVLYDCVGSFVYTRICIAVDSLYISFHYYYYFDWSCCCCCLLIIAYAHCLWMPAYPKSLPNRTPRKVNEQIKIWCSKWKCIFNFFAALLPLVASLSYRRLVIVFMRSFNQLTERIRFGIWKMMSFLMIKIPRQKWARVLFLLNYAGNEGATEPKK